MTIFLPNTIERIKKVILIGILVVIVVICGAFLLLSPPSTNSLKAAIINPPGQSPEPTNINIKVSNTSGRIVNFAFWMEVSKGGQWVRDELWDPKIAGQLHWIVGHGSASFELPTPSSQTWRFKIMGEEQPTTLKWKWLAMWKSKPRQWYFYVYPDNRGCLTPREAVGKVLVRFPVTIQNELWQTLTKGTGGFDGQQMTFHTGSRWSQRRLPLEFMDGLSYTTIIELAEPPAGRRGYIGIVRL